MRSCEYIHVSMYTYFNIVHNTYNIIFTYMLLPARGGMHDKVCGGQFFGLQRGPRASLLWDSSGVLGWIKLKGLGKLAVSSSVGRTVSDTQESLT